MDNTSGYTLHKIFDIECRYHLYWLRCSNLQHWIFSSGVEDQILPCKVDPEVMLVDNPEIETIVRCLNHNLVSLTENDIKS